MNHNKTEAKKLSPELIAALTALPAKRLSQVFLQYALDLTVSARMHFVDGRYQAAEACNETLHVVIGFVNILPNDKPRDELNSMIGLVVGDAEQKHRLPILRKALEVQSAITPDSQY